MRGLSRVGWARVAVSAVSALGLIVLSGLIAVPASASLPAGLYLNAAKASPALTYGQKFMDVVPNSTGESVRISVAPVVDGLTVTVNDNGNASGPCTPDVHPGPGRARCRNRSRWGAGSCVSTRTPRSQKALR
jgi:hypothetical protein